MEKTDKELFKEAKQYLESLKKVKEIAEDFRGGLSQKSAFIDEKHYKLKKILPSLYWFGLGLIILSLFLYLIELEGKFEIFVITKELWQMLFFLGIFISTVTFILVQIKYSLDLCELNFFKSNAEYAEKSFKSSLEGYMKKYSPVVDRILKKIEEKKTKK